MKKVAVPWLPWKLKLLKSNTSHSTDIWTLTSNTNTMEYLIKEVDIFPSVYSKDYQYFKGALRSKPSSDSDSHALTPAELDKFLKVKVENVTPDQVHLIHKQYERRLRSTYQVSYCSEMFEPIEKVSENLFDPSKDELLNRAAKLYSPYKGLLLAPLPTSRRVLGYCSPKLYNMGHSEYQETYSKVGYNRLEEEARKGVPRCGPKKHLYQDAALVFPETFKPLPFEEEDK